MQKFATKAVCYLEVWGITIYIWRIGLRPMQQHGRGISERAYCMGELRREARLGPQALHGQVGKGVALLVLLTGGYDAEEAHQTRGGPPATSARPPPGCCAGGPSSGLPQASMGGWQHTPHSWRPVPAPPQSPTCHPASHCWHQRTVRAMQHLLITKHAAMCSASCGRAVAFLKDAAYCFIIGI